MATYEITGADGAVYQIEGADDADPSAIVAQISGSAAQSAPAPAPDKPPSVTEQVLMSPIGAGELLLKAATGAVASIPAGVAYGGAAAGKALGANVEPSAVQRDVQQYLTYQPITQSGRGGQQALGDIVRPVATPVVRALDRAATKVGTVSPVAETMLREAPSAAAAASGVMSLAPFVGPAIGAAQEAGGAIKSAASGAARSVQSRFSAPPSAESVVSQLDSQQSMGAAAAAPSLSKVSPELKSAISNAAQRTGGGVNPQVLVRHVEADTLPVPLRLTEGQATQDPVLLSHEMNMRGKYPELAKHFNTQNEALAENVQVIRDQVGPDVFSANPVEHGDSLIAAYKALDDAAQVDIAAKYKALRDANGGQFPVDAKALLDSASTELHKGLLYDHAPKAIMSTLDRLSKTNKMTFENFESLRTNLARIQRSVTADGNEKAAAAVIRDAMEQLPLRPEAAAMKPLADTARAAARAQFQALEADPAYLAAVTESVPPDRFVQKFIIAAPRDDVALMRQNLASNDSALQTMGVAAVDHLRNAAKLNASYEGNFAAAGFNKGLDALGPKLNFLVPPDVAEQLGTLGNVARYTIAQPRGSYVNNSGTFVASAADYGSQAIEGAVNVAAGGIPVGTWGGKAIRAVSGRNIARRAIAPGAGLDRLQTPP